MAFINLPSIGTQDYTMEFFIRLDDKNHNHGEGYLFSTNYVTATSWAALGMSNTGYLVIYINGANVGGNEMPVAIAEKYTAGEWVHIAFVRNGLNTTFYVERFAVGSRSGNPYIPALKWCFGGSDPGISSTVAWFQGSIDSVRASVGIARYTEAFTPPPRGFK